MTNIHELHEQANGIGIGFLTTPGFLFLGTIFVGLPYLLYYLLHSLLRKLGVNPRHLMVCIVPLIVTALLTTAGFVFLMKLLEGNLEDNRKVIDTYKRTDCTILSTDIWYNNYTARPVYHFVCDVEYDTNQGAKNSTALSDNMYGVPPHKHSLDNWIGETTYCFYDPKHIDHVQFYLPKAEMETIRTVMVLATVTFLVVMLFHFCIMRGLAVSMMSEGEDTGQQPLVAQESSQSYGTNRFGIFQKSPSVDTWKPVELHTVEIDQ